MIYEPEKLNLWDRLFNRYRKEVIERGHMSIYPHPEDAGGSNLPRRVRQWVEYRVIDRLTGSVTIRRDYLD